VLEEHDSRNNNVLSSVLPGGAFNENGESREKSVFGGASSPPLIAQEEARTKETFGSNYKNGSDPSNTINNHLNQKESLINNTLINGNRKLRLSDDFIETKKDVLHSSQDVFEQNDVQTPLSTDQVSDSHKKPLTKKQTFSYLKNPPEAWQAIYKLLHSKAKTSTSSAAGTYGAANKQKNEQKKVAFAAVPFSSPKKTGVSTFSEKKSRLPFFFEENKRESRETKSFTTDDFFSKKTN